MVNHVYEEHSHNNPMLPFILIPNYVIPSRLCVSNWHENIEVLYCYYGLGYIKCGLDEYPFYPGDIFIVNTNTPHCVHCTTTVSYHALIIDNSFCKSNGIDIPSLHFQERIQDPQLVHLLLDIFDSYSRYDSDIIHTVVDIRYAVLGFLRKLCTDYIIGIGKSSVPLSCEHVKKALSYIRKNIAVPLSLESIASHVGISKFHLSREFKAYTGRTIIHTVNLIRCSEAKRLIESGMSVSAAASFCGFENLSYFTRAFKSIFHVLPSSLSKS